MDIGGGSVCNRGTEKGCKRMNFARREFLLGTTCLLRLLGSITVFPTQCTVLLNARTKNIVKISNMEYVFDLPDPYEYRMEKALDLLNRELQPNYEAMAIRPGLQRSTLSRRFRGVTNSRAEANSEIRQCLTIAQEEALSRSISCRSEICLLLRRSSKT